MYVCLIIEIMCSSSGSCSCSCSPLCVLPTLPHAPIEVAEQTSHFCAPKNLQQRHKTNCECSLRCCCAIAATCRNVIQYQPWPACGKIKSSSRRHCCCCCCCCCVYNFRANQRIGHAKLYVWLPQINAPTERDAN